MTEKVKPGERKTIGDKKNGRTRQNALRKLEINRDNLMKFSTCQQTPREMKDVL